jgi:hypothetical protein
MLAYLFWHSASAATDPQVYLQRLRSFHQQLSQSSPAGLLASYTWHVGTVSWLQDANCYEDWYVLEDASYLDTLAEAAVSHRLRSVHDAIAGLATSGVAGLFKPACGDRAQAEGNLVSWFSKPVGTSYDDLYGYLEEQDPSLTGGLWQRFLTLGPTPEFCLVTTEDPHLPAEYAPIVVSRGR